MAKRSAVLGVVLFLGLSMPFVHGVEAVGEDAPTQAALPPVPPEVGAKVDITVDVRKPETGVLGVTMAWTQLDGGGQDLVFKALGAEGEFAYRGVSAVDATGAALEVVRDEQLFTVKGTAGQTSVTLTYDAEPGGLGRHGHQGYVSESFTTFDGRIFLQPGHLGPIQEARLKYLRPDDWIVASPFEEYDGWWYLQEDGRGYLREILQTTCVGVGPYTPHTQTIGNSEIRVYTFSGWKDDYEAMVAEKSFKLFQWYHDQYGFDPNHAMAQVFTPMPDTGRVFGGAFVYGSCYEQPNDRARNWLLLGHRIAHPMNKYVPVGMTITDARDHWFMEGFASYSEVVSTTGAGLLPDDRYWNELYKWYDRIQEEKPLEDLALSQEHLAKGEAVEYLHYCKGPLVVKMLDTLMRQRSGTSVEAFMKWALPQYGFHQKSFPVRDAIEEFTGDNYDDFWEVMVDGRGVVVPTWDSYRTSELEERSRRSSLVVAGGQPYPAGYLHWLGRSGEFDSWAQVKEWTVEAAVNRQRMKAAGVDPLPPNLREVANGFSSKVRFRLEQLESRWPVPKQAPQRGCGGGAAWDQSFGIVGEGRDARDFALLLEQDAAFQQARVAPGVSTLGARVSKHQHGVSLAVGREEKIQLVTTWLRNPGQASFEILAPGENRDEDRRDLPFQPGWHSTRISFDTDQRPDQRGVLTLRVSGPEGWYVTRPLWQR